MKRLDRLVEEVLTRHGEVVALNVLHAMFQYTDNKVYLRGVLDRSGSVIMRLTVALNLPSKDDERLPFGIPKTDVGFQSRTIVFSATRAQVEQDLPYLISYVRPGRWINYLSDLKAKADEKRKSTLAESGQSIDDSQLFPDLSDFAG